MFLAIEILDLDLYPKDYLDYGIFFIFITPTLLLQRYEGDICPVITYVTIVTLWTAVTCFNILQRWGAWPDKKCCGSGIRCYFLTLDPDP
jgi:hypothetical protein